MAAFFVSFNFSRVIEIGVTADLFDKYKSYTKTLNSNPSGFFEFKIKVLPIFFFISRHFSIWRVALNFLIRTPILYGDVWLHTLFKDFLFLDIFPYLQPFTTNKQLNV